MISSSFVAVVLGIGTLSSSTLAQEDDGFNGPIFPVAPVGATEWVVGTTNSIEVAINRVEGLEYTNLKIEWATGSDTDQPVLAEVYDDEFPSGDFTTDSPFSVPFEQPSVKELQYPYGQRYFFKFTTTVADGTFRYNWSTRYWVLPEPGTDEDWPNVGEWTGEFTGKVEGSTPGDSSEEPSDSVDGDADDEVDEDDDDDDAADDDDDSTSAQDGQDQVDSSGQDSTSGQQGTGGNDETQTQGPEEDETDDQTPTNRPDPVVDPVDNGSAGMFVAKGVMSLIVGFAAFLL